MSKNAPTMLQLKIQLRNITKPPVWRRVLIPDNITFLELHYIIQAAFGWYNEHLFKFQCKPYDREWTVEVPEKGEKGSRNASAMNTLAMFGIFDPYCFGPAESLRKDLERLIMYHVGLTCDDISDDYDPGDKFNGVIGSSLILLADVGNGESSLDVVLEVMRQSPDFSEYHFCDTAEELLVPTLCKLGQEHLDKLIAYAKEPGLYGYLQSVAFVALRVMAFYNPDLREPVVEGFRELLRYYSDYSQSHDVDCELMGLLVSEVTDLSAQELLPQIKALFDAGAVYEGTSGDYKSIARDIKKRLPGNPVAEYSFNAPARFKQIRELYK